VGFVHFKITLVPKGTAVKFNGGGGITLILKVLKSTRLTEGSLSFTFIVI
jgi:hypothetical protein